MLLKVVGNPEDDDLANTKMQNLLKEDYPEVVQHFKKVGADEARKKANKEARECAAPLSAPFPHIFPWGGGDRWEKSDEAASEFAEGLRRGGAMATRNIHISFRRQYVRRVATWCPAKPGFIQKREKRKFNGFSPPEPISYSRFDVRDGPLPIA